jgi:hypothetical protein
MKLKSLLVAALLGVAAAFSAHASTTYTNGDLFLFVSNVAGSNGYVVDLGQSFNWNTSFQIPIADLTTDITDAVGSGWQTNSNVYFAVVGGTSALANSEHLVLSNASPSAYNYTKTSESSVANSITDIVSNWGSNDSAGSGLSGGNSQALEEVNSASDGDSFFQQVSGGFNGFTSQDVGEASVLGPLYLDNLITSNPSLSAPGLTLGSFSVDSANNSLDFTTAAVPEPSTVATVILGGAALFTIGRRRRRA